MFSLSKFNRHQHHISLFVFICDVSCNLNENISKDIIFQVLVVSKVLSRLDVSDNSLVQYGVQRKELNKLGCTKLKILIRQIS